MNLQSATSVLFLLFLAVVSQPNSDSVDELIEISRQRENEYTDGFACVYQSKGVETVFHKYPGGDDFYCAQRGSQREILTFSNAGKYFSVQRSITVAASGGAWELQHAGEKPRTNDGLLFQIERIVKSPWCVLGTPLHEILANPDIKQVGSGFVENMIDLEFHRTPDPKLSTLEKRPFFTDHERLSIKFEEGDDKRIVFLSKIGIGSNRGIQETIRFVDHDRYTVTDSDGVAYDVTVVSKDWNDRTELSLSQYGFREIEEAVYGKPTTSINLVLVMIVVGLCLLVLAFLLKRQMLRT